MEATCAPGRVGRAGGGLRTCPYPLMASRAQRNGLRLLYYQRGVCCLVRQRCGMRACRCTDLRGSGRMPRCVGCINNLNTKATKKKIADFEVFGN